MAYDSEYAFALDPSEVVDASIAADPWSASPDVGISNHVVSAHEVHFGSTDGHPTTSTTGTTAVTDAGHPTLGTAIGAAAMTAVTLAGGSHEQATGVSQVVGNTVANTVAAQTETTSSTTGTTVVSGDAHSPMSGIVGGLTGLAATMGGMTTADSAAARQAAETAAHRAEALIPVYGSDASEAALNAAYAYPSDFAVATPVDHAAPAGPPRIEDHPDYAQFTIDVAPAVYDTKGGMISQAGSAGTGDGGTGLVANLKDPTIIVNHDALTGGFDDMINQLANIYHRPMIHNPITDHAIYAQRGVDDGGVIGVGGVDRDDSAAVTKQDFDTLLHALTVHYADFPTLYEFLSQRAFEEYANNVDLYSHLSPDDAMERQLRYFTNMMKDTVQNPYAYFQSELDRIAYRMGYDNNQNFQGAEIQSILQAAFKHMPEAQINKIVEDAFKRGAKDKAKKKSSGWKKWLGAIVGIALAWTGVGAAIGAAITSATGVAGALSGVMIGNVAVGTVVNGVIGSTIIGGVLNGGDFGAAFRGAAIGGLGAVAGGFAGALTDNVISAVNPTGITAAFDGASSVATAAINTGAAATTIGSYVQTAVQVGTTAALNGGNIGQSLVQAGVATATTGLLGNIDGMQSNVAHGLGNLAGQLATDRFDFVSAVSAFNPTGQQQQPNRGPLFDDDGNLMPGAPADVRTQYDALMGQGLTPAEASASIMQVPLSTYGQSGDELGSLVVNGDHQVGGLTPTASSSVLFDDEGNLMPGASADVQAQYNGLIEFGLSPAEAAASVMGVAAPTQEQSSMSDADAEFRGAKVTSTQESTPLITKSKNDLWQAAGPYSGYWLDQAKAGQPLVAPEAKAAYEKLAPTQMQIVLEDVSGNQVSAGTVNLVRVQTASGEQVKMVTASHVLMNQGSTPVTGQLGDDLQVYLLRTDGVKVPVPIEQMNTTIGSFGLDTAGQVVAGAPSRQYPTSVVKDASRDIAFLDVPPELQKAAFGSVSTSSIPKLANGTENLSQPIIQGGLPGWANVSADGKSITGSTPVWRVNTLLMSSDGTYVLDSPVTKANPPETKGSSGGGYYVLNQQGEYVMIGVDSQGFGLKQPTQSTTEPKPGVAAIGNISATPLLESFSTTPLKKAQ